MIFFNLLNLFWHTDKNLCFYAEVNFWDFARNDNSNKGTTTWLNETRFGPKKKSSPIYLGPKNLDTFWWNCQIIFRCASIHGRAGFILGLETRLGWRPDRTFLRNTNLNEIRPCRFPIITVIDDRQIKFKSNKFYLKSARHKQYNISSQWAFEPTYINIT